MKALDQMIDDVIRREGGYTNNPNDKGGPTNFGITQADLSKYLGHNALISEVKNLSEDTAREIYEQRYYYGPSIQKLPEEIQPFIFDSAVNNGARRAIKFIQRVCNQAGYPPHLDEDGAMGPKTLAGANWALNEMKDYFLKSLIEERRMFYLLIVDHNPDQSVFIKGWLNRLNEFTKDAA